MRWIQGCYRSFAVALAPKRQIKDQRATWARAVALPLGLILLVLSQGCDRQQIVELLQQGEKLERRAPVASEPSPAAAVGAPTETISIASFNIQVFGQSKLKKPEVMDVLARVVRRYDVVAIQEIRSREQDVMPRFVELINSDGSRYDFVIGERLGRTSSKEQYAFVFDTRRIEVFRDSVYTVPDPHDRLHREPLAATFRVRGVNADQAFTFTLVNIHTDPDETDTELDALDDAFLYVKQQNPTEDDVLIVGDLNVDSRHLGQLGELPGATWVIAASTKTNTRGTKSYDNMVFDRRSTVEYQGQGGVLNLMTQYNLSLADALKVSDHLPVWAVFAARENAAPSRIATRSDNEAR